jgi:hypothetical protein
VYVSAVLTDVRGAGARFPVGDERGQ